MLVVMPVARHELVSNAPPLMQELRRTSTPPEAARTPGQGHRPDCLTKSFMAAIKDGSDAESVLRSYSASGSTRRRAAQGSKRTSKQGVGRAPSQRAERHAHYERLRALTVDPTSVFTAKYKDRQTGRLFERKERIPEAILPEEFDDYVAWRDESAGGGGSGGGEHVEQRRKKQYLERPRKELSKKEGQEGEEVWSRELDRAYQEGELHRSPCVDGC